MSSMGLGGIIEGGANATLGTINTGYGIFSNERQYSNQVKQQEYLKWLNQTVMDREDNAVQRRVKDLMAAGLHPGLAAGTGASADQQLAPQGAAGNQEISSPRINVMTGLAAINESEARARLANAQANTMDAEREAKVSGRTISNTTNLLRGNYYIEQTRREQKYYNQMDTLDDQRRTQIQHLLAQTAEISYNLQRSKEEGIRTTDHNQLVTLVEYIGNAIDKLLDRVLPSNDPSTSAIKNHPISNREEYAKYQLQMKQLGIDPMSYDDWYMVYQLGWRDAGR